VPAASRRRNLRQFANACGWYPQARREILSHTQLRNLPGGDCARQPWKQVQRRNFKTQTINLKEIQGAKPKYVGKLMLSRNLELGYELLFLSRLTVWRRIGNLIELIGGGVPGLLFS